ncbi:ABC transporter permease [Glycomyces terrestris]|uniref:ABC transporter permease n=1 Tax=Glycomyces terrestris TaxID=2493553 RepID=A0A426UVS5_9ACTN|nr:ABC transporter permease [Glycomyces terrestris]RRR98414.1 ABC transporter permease [Glycomyces terrestris]
MTAVMENRTEVKRVVFPRVLLSEWTKFRTLRSSWITLGLSLVLLGGLGAIAAFTYSPGGAEVTDGPPGIAGRPLDAVSLALMGLSFASMVVGVLGVLLSAGEYSTGMIRSTLAAVPKRLPVLWAKTLVAFAVVSAVATLGAFAAFLIGTAGLDGEAVARSLGDDGVVRSLAGAGAYLGLTAVFGVALGTLLRSPAGAIASLVGILLLVPGLAMLLPESWYDALNPYLPSNAGGAAYALTQAPDGLAPGEGLAVYAAWVALALAGAAVRLKRADS